MATVISQEQLKWLIDNCDSFTSYRDLAVCFNNVFSCNVCYNTIKAKMNKLGFRKPQICYTEEQNQWLRENIDKYSRKELVEEFNKKFDCDKKEDALKKHCNNELKIYFKTNVERWKKNASNSQKTSNVGTISKHEEDIYIKYTDDVNIKNKWMLLTRYINGLNSEDEKCVLIIDKNKPITKENTIVVDKSVMAILCKYKYFSLSPDLKRLAILISTHKNEIRKIKNNLKTNN